MFAPLDFATISAALTSREGWIELGLIAACFAVGWVFDRRVRWKSASGAQVVRRGLGSVNRLLLPLVTLALLFVALAVFRRWHPPFFLSIALPLFAAPPCCRCAAFSCSCL